MSFIPISFIPGQMESNFLLGLFKYDLAEYGEKVTAEVEARVGSMISAFTITVNGEIHRTEVGPRKYKSALLILYLADRFGQDKFRRDGTDREIIENYFPKNLVEAALNGSMDHPTIAYLLAQGSVMIEIERPAQN